MGKNGGSLRWRRPGGRLFCFDVWAALGEAVCIIEGIGGGELPLVKEGGFGSI